MRMFSHWTVVVLPDDPSGVRQIRVPRRRIRAWAALAAFVVAMLMVLSAGFVVRVGERSPVERLAAENDLLAAEVSELDNQLHALELGLDEWVEREASYRSLAGLEPLQANTRVDTLPARLFQAMYPLGTDDLATLTDRAQRLAARWTEVGRSLTRLPEELSAIPSIRPAAGFLSRPFGASENHPLLPDSRPHEGLDIAAPEGTPVVATAEGRVRFVGEHSRLGLVVELEHGNGYTTRYAHLKRALVRRSQSVDRGARIGVIGQTGISIGPHVHYEVLVDGRPQDPSTFMLSPLLDGPIPD